MALPEIDGFTSDLQRIFAMRFLSEAETLAQRAADCGLVLTIEQLNQQPPCMGNFCTAVAVRPDLRSVREAYAVAVAAQAPAVALMTEAQDCTAYSRLSLETQKRIEAGLAKFCQASGAAA